MAGQWVMTCECRQARVRAGMGLHSAELVCSTFATVLASAVHFPNPSLTTGIHSGVFERPVVKYFCAADRSMSPPTHSPIQFCGEWIKPPACLFCSLVWRKSVKHCMKIWSSTTFGWLQHDCGFWGAESQHMLDSLQIGQNITHYVKRGWSIAILSGYLVRCGHRLRES